MLERLAEAPKGQIDPEICKRLKALASATHIGARTELHTIIDDCIQDSLTSSFALLSLQHVYETNSYWTDLKDASNA